MVLLMRYAYHAVSLVNLLAVDLATVSHSASSLKPPEALIAEV